MIGVLAFVAGIGTWIAVDALRPRPPRVRLTDQDQRSFIERALDVLFAPAARRVVAFTGQMDLDDYESKMEQKLKQANYPPPFTSPDAVLGYRLFTATLAAVFGGVFAFLIGLGMASVPLMLGLGALGWFIPGRSIEQAIEEREEQLTLDAASTLDRLAIYVAAGNALPAAIQSLADRPGGAWVGEFRKVAGEYAVTGDFQGSLDAVVRDSGYLPDIARVCERLRAAYGMGGGGIADSLRRMARDARIDIRLMITERGYKNAVKMVIPAFFAIIATTIILVAPGAVQMVSVLMGGP
jgi:hypothetical protein